MKQKIRFIINPISGVGQKNELPSIIKEHLDADKFDYEIVYTSYPKHAKELAFESSKQKIDIVCAVGGDGSVHEVGTALIGTQTALAIIPCGSGNGIARHLNIPLEITESIFLLNDHNEILIDTVLVNDKSFLGTGGYAFDALIAKKFDEQSSRGFWTYVKLVLKEYFHFKSMNFEIELDGKKFEKELILCTIANVTEYGNNFCISPNSDASDGFLELCMLKPFPKTLTPFIIRQFFKKTIDQSPFMEIVPFKKARIRCDAHLAHYDGEPYEVREELNIEVKEKSLKVLVRK
jgi:diacylglycerol kinase (ATP)